MVIDFNISADELPRYALKIKCVDILVSKDEIAGTIAFFELLYMIDKETYWVTAIAAVRKIMGAKQALSPDTPPRKYKG